MKEEATSIVDFLRYSIPGYMAYLYFILLAIPYINETISLNDWKVIIGLVFGGIPIGASLGYLAYSFHESIFQPYNRDRCYAPNLSSKIGAKSMRHEFIRNLAKDKLEPYICEVIMDTSHIQKRCKKDSDAILSTLRRRWSIYYNLMVVGLFSPIIGIVVAIILKLYVILILQNGELSLNVRTGEIIYYLAVFSIILFTSIIILYRAQQKYREADQIELMALKENMYEIKRIISKMKTIKPVYISPKNKKKSCRKYN